MPLDTAPLSIQRRLLALLVLVVMLGGSLALAQYIVASRDESIVWDDGVKIQFSVPDDFEIIAHDNGENPDHWLRDNDESNDALIIERSDDTLKLHSKPADGAAYFESEILAGLKKQNYKIDPPATIPFGDTDARLFIGRTQDDAAIIVIAGGLVRDHYTLLQLSGDKKPISDDDIKMFKRIFATARITVDGQPYAPPARNRPATASSSATGSAPAKGPKP